MSLEKEYKATMIETYKYMVTKDDIQSKALLRHQNIKALYSVPKEVREILSRMTTWWQLHRKPRSLRKMQERLHQKDER